MPSVEHVVRTDTGLAAELALAAMRLNRRLANDREPRHDLSITAMAVLADLYRRDAQTIGELARSEHIQAPAMTRTVDHLESDGYVERRRSETDRRRVMVCLSDLGRETVLAGREKSDAWLAQGLADLTAEERECLRRAAPILHRLADKD